MELDIDFVVFMRIVGILMAVVLVVGAIVVPASFIKHNREREQRMSGSHR